MNPLNNDKDWEVRDTATATIILPRKDIRPHIAESIDCPCRPDVAIYNPFFGMLQTPLIAHYSFKDGQRVSEALKDLFKEV